VQLLNKAKLSFSTRRSQWGQGAMPHKFEAYLVILCLEKRRLKQKYCCSPKVKHFISKHFVLAIRHGFQRCTPDV